MTAATPRQAWAQAIARYAISVMAGIAVATTVTNLADGRGPFSFELGLSIMWWAFWLLVLPGVPLFLVLLSIVPRLERSLPKVRVELLAAVASMVVWLAAAAALILAMTISTDPESPATPKFRGGLVGLVDAALIGAVIGIVEGVARRRSANRAPTKSAN